jgi:hypothetical protein
MHLSFEDWIPPRSIIGYLAFLQSLKLIQIIFE